MADPNTKRFTYKGTRIEVWKGNDNEGKLGYDPWHFRPVSEPAASKIQWHVMGPSKTRDEAIALAKFAVDRTMPGRQNPRNDFGSVQHFEPRFVPKHLLPELSNLWHLSRTALAGKSSSRYERLLWTSAAFSKEHPEISPTAAYKDLDTMLSFGGRNPGKGWFTRCMESVSASGSAIDPRAVCGAQLKNMGYRRRNPKVPGIAGWNTYAGGTSPAPGNHSYDLYIEPGHLAGGRRQYVISPVSYSNGRHRGYLLQVAGSPESSGLWKDLGMHRSPQQAASAARRHYEGTSAAANPRRRRRNPGKKKQPLPEGWHAYQQSSGWWYARWMGYDSGPFKTKAKAEAFMRRFMQKGVTHNRRRTRNAGPFSIRKHKKAFKTGKYGEAMSRATRRGDWQPGIRATRPRGKPRTMTNPRRFTLRAAGREFIVLAKSLQSAWREVHGWLKKEGIVSNPSGARRTVRREKAAQRKIWCLPLPRLTVPRLHNKIRESAKRRAKRTRNRSVSMLTPRARRRTIRAVERRTSAALGKYLGGRRRY